MPPSVSLIVLVHSCALAKRRFRDSLKGDSHGSSWTTPVKVSVYPVKTKATVSSSGRLVPVPSGATPFGAALPFTPSVLAELATSVIVSVLSQ